MKYDGLKSIEPVINNSKFVHINKKNINKICDLIQNTPGLSYNVEDYINLKDMNDENKIRFFLLCESINFCYWGKEKWKIEYNDKTYSGSIGLTASLFKAFEQGYDIFDFNKFMNISFDEFKLFFKGTCEIPLIRERHNIIKDVARKVYIDMNDNLLDKVLECSSDIELLEFFVDNFDNFKDISKYDNRDVYFFKRGTLLVNDLYQSVNVIKKNIRNINNLRACADYKIPQVLRQNNIFKYTEELKNKIDNKIEIKHDSIEEIEIRANTICVVELIKDKMKNKGLNMTSIEVDNMLWLLSKNKSQKSFPHHLTRTIYY